MELADIGLEKVVLGAALGNCMLDHSEPMEATNAIQQEFTFGRVSIPICEECEEALASPDWVLIYCVECCSSMWIYKPKSKKPHLYEKMLPGEIMWLKFCPKCQDKGDE